MAVHNATPGGVINGDEASTVLNADLANILRKVKEGRTLTGPERQYFLSIKRQDAEPTALRFAASARELAEIIGVNPITIRRALKRTDHPGRRPDGAYDVSVWRAWLEARGSLTKSKDIREGLVVNGENGHDLETPQLKARSVKLRNEQMEFKLAKLRGEFLPAKDVEQRMCEMILNAKRKLLQIVTLAPQIVGLTPVEAEVMLQAAVDAVIDEMSANPFGQMNEN
jgi:transposase